MKLIYWILVLTLLPIMAILICVEESAKMLLRVLDTLGNVIESFAYPEEEE